MIVFSFVVYHNLHFFAQALWLSEKLSPFNGIFGLQISTKTLVLSVQFVRFARKFHQQFYNLAQFAIYSSI